MSEEIREDARRKVTSVGNSWIVCKSKSHSGHVYYFNTLTGEAAWNLSDAEIEKAKSRTKHLECLPGAKPTRCPEPKDKPPSYPLNNLQPAQKIFDDSFVIKEQQSVLTFSNVPNNATFVNPIHRMSGLMQHTQINNPHSVETVCNLNNSISAFNLSTAPSIYNPKVWDIPHTQPFFMAPTIAPILNHAGASLNIANNTFPQSASGIVLNSFENAHQSNTITRGMRTFNPRHQNYGQGGQQNSNKKFVFSSKNDLRQKLSARKRLNRIPSGGSGVIRTTPRKSDMSSHITHEVEGINSNDLRDDTMENRCVDTQLHESSSKIDLNPLKCLAPSNSNSDAWFIVVDLDVLLNEFKFLNTLTDSDEMCHLMVPKRVMEELKNYVTCTENIQAKRILRFVSQQIEIGYVFMAEEPSEVEGDSMAEFILATCTELSENKYHLILLSNDNELLTCKGSSSVNIFTIEEIKNLLTENANVLISAPKKPFVPDPIFNKIKITVPNDTPQETTFDRRKTPVRDIPLDDGIKATPVTQNTPKQNDTQDKPEQSQVLKHTVDASIQTDFDDINASFSVSSMPEKQDLDAAASSTQNTKETTQMPSVSLVFNVPDKKREIKLKRSISNQPPLSVESEKKQFKWRRRRNTTPQPIPSSNYQNTNLNNVESLDIDGEIKKQQEKKSNNIPSSRNENKVSDDSIESRESSIYADHRNSTNYTKENVTIEETSTSGIISNTESNIDVESNCSNSMLNPQNLANNEDPHHKHMYEIDSITMEDYLKMKCDEWVSRFIQIMEEVLSLVLQQDPPFSHRAMPPPWTLHEAAQCVAIKFCTHQDVKDAANKLSSILFHVSDAKGKITMNMTPNQYMQMYSYGVHLLAAIMKVTDSCEDIQIAVELLKKLLEDIRNPNMDNSTNDNFNDNIQDNCSNNGVSYSDRLDNHDDSVAHEQETFQDYNETEAIFNHVSKKRKLTEEESPKPVKFIRNFDIKFFSSLKLKRKNTVNNSDIENNVSYKPQVQSHEEQRSTDSQTEERNESKDTRESNEKVTVTDDPNNQPCIIRNFTLCPELEAKLKRKYNSKVYENHDDELDYDEDYGEYLTEEYGSEDDNYNVNTHNTNDKIRNDVTVNNTNVPIDTNENSEPKGQVDEPCLMNDHSKKFKYMMCMLLQEIKNGLCQVKILCDQCYKEFKDPKQTTEEKIKLRKMAERAHLHIIRLCRSLESMLDHETNNPTQNMYNLLKQADININQVDNSLLLEYRITVAKCKGHADEFLNSIQNIISAFNS